MSAAKVTPLNVARSGPTTGVVRRPASAIEMRRTTFLDEAKMLPKASLVVVAGRAGLGKTLYAGALTALATTGGLDGGPFDVLYSTGEDDPASVLVPRLVAAGADLDRVHFTEYRVGDNVGQPLTLPDDTPALAAHAREVRAGLVVIDPIAAHLSEKVDSHRDASVRKALGPLAAMAAELDLTVLVVAHPKKGHEADVLSRLSGSGAFGNAPRSVMVFGVDPDDEEGDRGSRRVLAHAKTNVSALAESVACHIEIRDLESGSADPWLLPVLVLDGASPHGASDVIDGVDPEERTERDEAKAWLLEALELPVRTTELKAAARKREIGWRTVQRAKSDLGVVARKAPDRHWYWLPPGREEL